MTAKKQPPKRGKVEGHTCGTCARIGPNTESGLRKCSKCRTGTRANYRACSAYQKAARSREKYETGLAHSSMFMEGAKGLRGETGKSNALPKEPAPKPCLRCDRAFKREAGSKDRLCEDCHRANERGVDTMRFGVVR